MASPARLTTALALPNLVSADWGSYLARGLASADRLLDCLAVFAAVYAADAVHLALRGPAPAWASPSARFLCAGGFALAFVFLLERHGGYRPCLSLLAIRETERVLRVTLQTFSLALVVVYFCAVPVSRTTIALALILAPLLLVLEKWEVHKLLCTLRSKGFGTRRAVIVGTGSTARRIYTALVGSPKFGVEPVAFVEEGATTPVMEIYECSYRRKHSAKVLPGPLSPELFRRLDASVLVVAEPSGDPEEMQRTMAEAAEMGVSTYFAAEEFVGAGLPMDYAEVDGMLLAHPFNGCNRAVYDVGKRTLDLVLAGIAALLLVPLVAAIAVLVKKTSAGPVFFRQQRVGKAGRLFTILKFRTMYHDAPQYDYSPVEGEDPRITPLGRFLRRTSLDEIPQFLNVLRGEMSLVGPRPEMPFIVEQYSAAQRQRLLVKPGITGLWQISADRAFLIHENPEYDAYYLSNNPRFVLQVGLQFAGLKKFSGKDLY